MGSTNNSLFKSGRKPDHIDSHHNVHGKNEKILSVAIDLARKFVLPLRNPFKNNKEDKALGSYNDVKMPEKMLHKFFGENATFEESLIILDEVVNSEKEVFEMNCHSTFIDFLLVDTSSYCMECLKELRILTSEKTKDAIDKRGYYEQTTKLFKKLCEVNKSSRKQE